MNESPKTQNNEDGFIKIILIVLITVVILSILNIDIRKIIESESFQNNFSYLKEIGGTVWGWIVYVWVNYLKAPAVYLMSYIQNLPQQ